MDIEVFDDHPIDIELPGFFYLWCCDCGLRHLTVVDVKGKGAKDFKKSKGIVRIAMSRDDSKGCIILRSNEFFES